MLHPVFCFGRSSSLMGGLVLALTVIFPLHGEETTVAQNQETAPVTGHCLFMNEQWAFLRTHGVDFAAMYCAEIWGNTMGGERTGAVYTGLGTLSVDIDLETLMGWNGASFHNSWLWLSGQDASEELVGNFLTISNIAGFQTFRMFELWLQQELWDKRISLRLGQLAADSEFVISDYASIFLNGTFGWPAFTYENIPEGGPGYPMATLGVRLELHPASWLTYRGAVFQGDVSAQNVNRHGFRWRLDSQQGFFSIHELEGRWNKNNDSAALPGSLKIGGWFHSGPFDRVGDPGSVVRGNGGFYFIADQMIWREKPRSTASEKEALTISEESDRNLGAFTRIAFGPPDRNIIGFYVDAGLVYTGLLPWRPKDVTGVAIAYAQLTPGAGEELLAGEARNPGYEIAIEFTYQMEITPWWSIQPDLQIILHPGGTRDNGNALVIGARSTFTF